IVEHRLDVVPGQFMNEPNLVGIHEAGGAHHVAAVGQIDGEHRYAAVGDRAGTVFVQRGIVVGSDVAAGKNVFQVLKERRVDGHNVFEMTVNGAILHHEDFAIALDNLGFDFARL